MKQTKKKTMIKLINALIVSGLVLIYLSGCATSPPPQAPKDYPRPYRVGKTWYQPIPDSKDFRQKGTASWYGKKFHGRKTSNGETYNMYDMTAAHKTLPFGTYVEVRNLKNNKKIKVRINDRGPFVRSRIIDLSYKAAKDIGIVGPGTGPVEIVALGSASPKKQGQKQAYVPGDYYSGNFTFQIGAFTNKENAEKLQKELSQLYHNAHITKYENGYETFYRVRVGKCTTLAQAVKLEEVLIRSGYNEAFIVAE